MRGTAAAPARDMAVTEPQAESPAGTPAAPALLRWYLLAGLVVAGLVLHFVLGPSTPVPFDVLGSGADA